MVGQDFLCYPSLKGADQPSSKGKKTLGKRTSVYSASGVEGGHSHGRNGQIPASHHLCQVQIMKRMMCVCLFFPDILIVH